MAIDTVVGGVQATFGEPRDVAGLETTCPDSVEWTIPVESLSGDLEGTISITLSNEM